ncbi:hypothetical protein GCM10027262_34090 [Nocardia tengchongensis]
MVTGTSCADSFHSSRVRVRSAAVVMGRPQTGCSAPAARKRSKNSRNREWWLSVSASEYRFGLVSKSMWFRVPFTDW